jgi:hypothetical protein
MPEKFRPTITSLLATAVASCCAEYDSVRSVLMGTSCFGASLCHSHDTYVNKLIMAQLQSICLQDVPHPFRSSTSLLA